MRRAFAVLLLVLFGAQACQSSPLPANDSDGVATVVAATLQAYTQAAPSGLPVTFQNVSFRIPDGLASLAAGKTVAGAAVAEAGPFRAAPEHIEFTLNGYASSGSLQMLEIRVYPAQEYAALNTYAAQCVSALQAKLNEQTLSSKGFPGVPFILGGGPLFLAQAKRLEFHGGSGARVITQLGEHAGQVTNMGTFYNFQGLTSDGKYYIVAVLPIGAPFLAYDALANPPQPADAIPFPPGNEPDEQQLLSYYSAVAAKIDATQPDTFSPSLNKLDELFQSLEVK